MSQAKSSEAYRPEPIEIPVVYSWPPKPLDALKWLVIDLMMPWGYIWLALAFLGWYGFSPAMSEMQQLSPGWIAVLWLRNAAFLTLVAGGLHWWYYIHKGQEKDTKFTHKWLAEDDDKFLWRDQVKDNMFWSLASGVTIWTAYEALTLWWYANGNVVYSSIGEAPILFVISIWAVMFWSTLHFYLNHRLLHWGPLFDISHELHHRNANTGPWTGISMHPIEHVIYFSVFLIWWVVPVHPVIIALTGIFQGVAPSVSHSGFDYLKICKRIKISTGDNFHNLHHRFFHINYGNVASPLDKLFNSWHGGDEAGKAVLKQRLRSRSVAGH